MKRWFSCLIAVMVLLMPIAAANATEHKAADDPSMAAELGDEPIFSVQVPANINFVIDPLELAGLGQVYSKEFPVINHSSVDVLFVLTDVQVTFAEDTYIEPLVEPVDFGMGIADDRKSIYLELDFGREDGAHLILTDADSKPPPILLSAAGEDGDSCALRISGSVSLYPAEEWSKGDVRIQLTYQLEASVPEALDMHGRNAISQDEEEEDAPEESAVTSPPATTPLPTATAAPGASAEGATAKNEGDEDMNGEIAATEPPAPTPIPNS